MGRPLDRSSAVQAGDLFAKQDGKAALGEAPLPSGDA